MHKHTYVRKNFETRWRRKLKNFDSENLNACSLDFKLITYLQKSKCWVFETFEKNISKKKLYRFFYTIQNNQLINNNSTRTCKSCRQISNISRHLFKKKIPLFLEETRWKWKESTNRIEPSTQYMDRITKRTRSPKYSRTQKTNK